MRVVGELHEEPEGQPLSAKRMRRVIPDVRLIYLVRDPVSRSISHYLHTYAKGEESRSISDALSDLDSPYVTRSLYYRNLEPYLDFVSPSDILIVSQEELLTRRKRTMREVFRFCRGQRGRQEAEFERMYQTAAEKLGESGVATVGVLELDDAVRTRLEDHFALDVKRLRNSVGANTRRGACEVLPSVRPPLRR